MENDVVVLSKLNLLKIADDIKSRQKLGDNAFFERLSNYHPNIKFAIELHPSKFLDTKLTNISGAYKFNIY